MPEENLHQQFKLFGISSFYISEFVYGGIDGVITTFAVVAGAAGANLDYSIVVILGMANLFADGFSMSVGNFFSSKAERDNFDRQKALEYFEVENLREEEINEVREIYKKKGFSGQLLEEVVAVITSDRDVWVDTMMREELGITKSFKPPLKTAIVTFGSFLLIGIIPILAYIFAAYFKSGPENLFVISCISTGIALAFIGALKSIVTNKNKWIGILETLFLGGAAATVAYYVGAVLENLFT